MAPNQHNQQQGGIPDKKVPKKGDIIKVIEAFGENPIVKEGYKFSVKCTEGDTVYILDRVILPGDNREGTFCSCGGNHRWRLLSNHYEIVEEYKPKPKILDFAYLDKLVISPEARGEIKAVIKQHENSKKLFDEWGIGDTIEYGRGMTFLFYGLPGTGKTWAANCISKTMGSELLVISAAEIQTSEPGGANRNIQNAFKAAKEDDKVLFLDECDSLITNRSDVGMILGGEINTLLTEIEKSEGVVILATNRIENLDAALERRISLIVEFPEPDFSEREKIWELLIPKKMPLGEGVTIKKLAEFRLTGGQIKNIVLHAARVAAAAGSPTVDMTHFSMAIDRINKSKSLMGSASSYRQILVKDKRSDDYLTN